MTEAILERLSDESIRRRLQRHKKRNEQFLKGPIPMPWLERAAALPGQTLAVGLAIWFAYGLQRNLGDVAVTDSLVGRFGVSRKARYRAIETLESHGLVTVVRRSGRALRVTPLLADDL